jgi:hypothetical protein
MNKWGIVAVIVLPIFVIGIATLIILRAVPKPIVSPLDLPVPPASTLLTIKTAPAPPPQSTPRKIDADPQAGLSTLTDLFLVFEIQLIGSSATWRTWASGYSNYSSMSSDEAASTYGKNPLQLTNTEELRIYRGSAADIDDSIERFHFRGGDGMGFMQNDPVRLMQHEGDPVIVYRVASDVFYNTLRTTTRTRAVKTLDDLILDKAGSVSHCLYKTPIKKIGICVFYGAKDFTAESLTGLECEVVFFLCSVSDAQNFANKKTTDQEFLDSSDLYLFSNNSMRKVSLRLDE